MAAPKFTKTQREIHLAEVARLDRGGYTTTEIAANTGVTQQQVSYDLKVIRARYAKVVEQERKAKVWEKLALLRELRKEAWEAWERSKANSEKEVTDSVRRIVEAKDAEGRPRPLTAQDLKNAIEKVRKVTTT
jgi:DNA-binding transcriptional ArsR family regulator